MMCVQQVAAASGVTSGAGTQDGAGHVPRLTTDELDGWIDEFRAHESSAPAAPQMVDVSWDETTIDSALILMRLEQSGTEVYLQREIGGSPDWMVTFEARPEDVRASADQVAVLAAEVAAVGRLCAHLTVRTGEHLARLAEQDGAPAPV